MRRLKRFWQSLIMAAIVMAIVFGSIAGIVGVIFLTFYSFFDYGPWVGFAVLFTELVLMIAGIRTFSD